MRTTYRRGSRLSSRPFLVTIFLVSLLTAYSFLAAAHQPSKQHRSQGDSIAPQLVRRNDEPTCHDVHTSEDQCAFVRQYCIDDDAGLLPYLELYFCTLGHVKPVAFIILVVWLAMLFTTIGIAASDFFSVNLSTIATLLGLSESLAGVTFLAFGNGSPDVFSTFAAMASNSASMAVGELIGAACFIAGVVAGSMALVREFRVDKRTYARDICFFIVAVAFTMVFLADGHLRFWECCIMIGYYVVYVVTVVTLHWYSKRRKQRLRREGEARSQVYSFAGQPGDELDGEPYRDDMDDVDTQVGQPRPQEQTPLMFDHGPRIEVDRQGSGFGWTESDDDVQDDHERMVAAEVTSSMRVLRTGAKRSHHPKTPIRPSLVGALEFRSALAQLQRESNLQLSPIPDRRHSENVFHHRERRVTTGAMPALTQRSSPAIPHASQERGARDRALSTGHTPVSAAVPSELVRIEDVEDSSLVQERHDENGAERSRYVMPPVPTVGGNLAPPFSLDPTASGEQAKSDAPRARGLSPSLNLQIPSSRSSYSGGSSPASPFPRYTDSPSPLTPNVHSDQPEYFLPNPALRERSFVDLPAALEEPRPVTWWPYALLPPPHILLATLFPTLQGWRDKTYWDRFVSTISVPSIFLLVVTLPVVESDGEGLSEDDTIMDARSHSEAGPGQRPPSISVEPDPLGAEGEWERFRRYTLQRGHSSRSSHIMSPSYFALEREDTAVVPGAPAPLAPLSSMAKPVSDTPSISNANDEKSPWNRWLVCVQLFTGPLFAIFIVWANIREDFENPGTQLLKMILYTLIGSLVLLALLLLTTSERTRPKYHHALCFMGFIISIAWISTIAEEVVGVLKMLGVVLSISDALLGLTIFAAGNSVGDLIADITVARLGYPVMALSACFGGPMLNILLGIGIGGVVMMIQKANTGDGPKEYGPYPVQVGGTLMISAITLLIILACLLILVPMNKWILSRKIGWLLIGLWAVSTIVNVIVELTGAWGKLA